MMLVSRVKAALYECRDCGTANALTGSCRGCGVPAVVEDRPTRRHARPAADWMLTLAHNLAVGGALMISALLAEMQQTRGIRWMPGEGRRAPGFAELWP